ncbi:probable pathogenesis-related protein ARB_02861 isoform X2 [Nematostella vectensis]|nr:probable pathogenesis-related protein ARB_02861 isoform X2 [Nematostella vectensis]
MASYIVPGKLLPALLFFGFSIHLTLCSPLKNSESFFNFLDLIDVDSECKDELAKCAAIPLQGAALTEYCETWKNKSPVIRKCRKTCGWCKPPSPEKQTCRDERSDCEWILNNVDDIGEYCERWKDDPAVRKCRKTCGLCNKIPSPPNPTEAPEPETIPPQPETVPPQPGTEEPEPVTQAPEPPKPKTSAPEPPKPGQMSGFEKECLDAHNMYRMRHGVPPLTWNSKLTRDAQSWADTLVRENKFEHHPALKELGQGENLAYFAPANRKCDGPEDTNYVHCGEIVKDWYDEIRDYDFNKGAGKDMWSVVLHFTQVVWRDTTEVGMATAVSPVTNKFYTVARYKPAGNQGTKDDFKENVPPAIE